MIGFLPTTRRRSAIKTMLAAAVGLLVGGTSARAADAFEQMPVVADPLVALTRVTTAPGEAVSPQYFQVVNPADKARSESAGAPRPATNSLTATGVPAPPRLRSYEMPAIEVVGERLSPLKEEDLIGSYEQPRWTAARRFPGTRIYVIPEGTAEFEFWLRPTVPRHGSTGLRSLWELELGLPGRFQLDLYFRTESETHSDTKVGESVEIRYALADWGKIWGNPTLYLEWSRLEDEPDAVEFKLLLGGEIAPRWHWGVNFSDELQTGGDRENEIEMTAGISYTLLDSRFSIGVETEIGFVDTHDTRGDYENFFFVGPSIQWRPTEQFHIDFAPLVGVTGDSPRFRAYLVIGYEF